MNKFDQIVEGSLSVAQTEAIKRKNTELYPIHLVYGLMSNPQTYSSRGLKKYKSEIEKLLAKVPASSSKVEIDSLRASTKLSEWLTYASSEAIQRGKTEISERDLIKFMPQILPELIIDYKEFSPSHDGDPDNEKPDFLTDLNELAMNGKLDPVIGRSMEIRAVMEILGRRGKNNPVLVGPAGVGKTAIVEGLAEAIVKGNVPDVLQGKTVYSLDLGSLMA